MEQIADRILILRSEGNMTQAELAKKIGVAPVTISKWELELSKPKSESSMRICKLFNVSLEWLNYGGVRYADPALATDLISIPYSFDMNIAAGDYYKMTSKNSKHNILIPQELLKKKFEHIVCVKVEGDSMEPVFQDQSMVFVDLNDQKVVDGSVYIVNHNQMLRMKKLEITPNGYYLKSFNKDYIAIPINVNEIPFSIVGKVVMQLSFYS